MPRSLCPRDLFTRVQIEQMTGVDDSTLNYWMREGILRASEGGEGRGNYRRFSYHEVTLAALLRELRNFGINTSSIAHVARRFHRAMDWMSERKISDENHRRILDLFRIRKEIVENGCATWIISGAADRAWFSDFEKHSDGRSTWAEMNWEEAVAHWFRPNSAAGMCGQPTEYELSLVKSWTTQADFADFGENELYWQVLSKISFEETKGSESFEVYYFRKDVSGDWHLSCTARPIEGSGAFSFIAVDMAMLTYQLWKNWAERSGSALAWRNIKAGILQ